MHIDGKEKGSNWLPCDKISERKTLIRDLSNAKNKVAKYCIVKYRVRKTLYFACRTTQCRKKTYLKTKDKLIKTKKINEKDNTFRATYRGDEISKMRNIKQITEK